MISSCAAYGLQAKNGAADGCLNGVCFSTAAWSDVVSMAVKYVVKLLYPTMSGDSSCNHIMAYEKYPMTPNDSSSPSWAWGRVGNVTTVFCFNCFL